MKVISTMVLWNIWKWFQHWFFLWNTWKWFQQCIVKYMKVISTMVLWNTWKWFQISIVKYMKVISTMVLWNTWKWFQHWFFFFCEIHESDFNLSLVKYMKVISTFVLWNTWKWFQISIVKYMKVISTMSFRVDENFKGSHTCMVEIWFVNRSQRWWKLLKKVLYLRLRSDLL